MNLEGLSYFWKKRHDGFMTWAGRQGGIGFENIHVTAHMAFEIPQIFKKDFFHYNEFDTLNLDALATWL